MSNPFTQVYESFWGIVDTDPLLRNIVKVGNRIRFDTTSRTPNKPARQDADIPELTISPAGTAIPSLTASSTSAFFRLRYTITVIMNDLRVGSQVTPNVYDVEFALYGVLARAKDKMGLCFVHYVRPVSSTILRNLEGTQGWTLNMDVEVEINLSRDRIYRGLV